MYFAVGSIIPIIGISYNSFTASKAWLVAVPQAITTAFTFFEIKKSIPFLVKFIILSLDLLPYGKLWLSQNCNYSSTLTDYMAKPALMQQ